MNEYPEHDKLMKVQANSQACGEFLDWLLGRYTIGEYHEHTDACWPPDENHTERRRTCGYSDDVLYPAGIDVRKLLAQFFGIDEDKLEDEKREMIDQLRKNV